MQLLPLSASQIVRAYDENSILIGETRYTGSIWLLPDMLPLPWEVRAFDALTVRNFDVILSRAPDVLLVGTGNTQRFLCDALLAELLAYGVGVECMPNRSACGTFNLLAGEGRRVALALCTSHGY
ncbi:MAG: MTH938/NDUFAF3 family protein [Burkholderiaceae bacterium]|jgi:uncharacterized protein|nr:MTH938/NDUFAF3 family protein [Burkholderiaceae bacterium]